MELGANDVHFTFLMTEVILEEKVIKRDLLLNISKSITHTTVLQPSWIFSGTIRVSQHQKSITRKVKPIWIYWSKRQ